MFTFTVTIIIVHVKSLALPPGGPHIQGHHREVEIGESITINCTSLKSKPAAELNFYINDKNVSGPARPLKGSF